MSREHRFRVVDRGRACAGTLTVDQGRQLATFRPYRSRTVYTIRLDMLATLLVVRAVKMDLASRGKLVPPPGRLPFGS